MGLKYYLEAIPLSMIRPYIKGNKDKYVNRLKDWFDNKWRIYLPTNNSLNVSKNINNEIENEIKQALSNTQYELKDFNNGIAFDTKNKREVKLGKILNRIKPELLQKFNNAESRQGKKIKDVLVVISRHPYDILGQSYDRGWTSCKKLESGMYQEYLKDEIFLVIVAYLVYEDDRNIQKPIARVLATPYFDNEYRIYYKINRRVYGSAGQWEEAFIKTFQDWLNEKQKGIIGSFKINPFVYSDQMPAEISIIDKSKLPQWIKDSKNMPESFSYAGKDNNTFQWEDGTWHDGNWEHGIWKNGTWVHGTWKDGTWKNGFWQGGHFFDGIWYDGTWFNGTWYNGEWYGGHWKDGIHNDGVWHGGLWYDGWWESGYWKNGMWQHGTWKNGSWDNGIWDDGLWRDGEWMQGQWKNGTWKFGMWYNGTWVKGTWERGTWQNGTWQNGIWEKGTWQKGTWQNGTWKDGLWLNGIWENGTWENGTWRNGTWKSGTWEKGYWDNGIWEQGVWHNGTWGAGRWKNGMWYDGVWKTGIWDEGQIKSKVYDMFIFSRINPKRFEVLEKETKEQGGTLEDFKKVLKNKNLKVIGSKQFRKKVR